MAFQEEVSEKAVNLAVSIGKITIGEIRKAVDKLLSELEGGKHSTENIKNTTVEKSPEPKQGKMTLAQLKKDRGGVTPLELTDPNLRLLNHEMKKSKIDFSVVKDGKGKYTLFFKCRDADEMTRAFKKYSQRLIRRENGKPSIKNTLAAAKIAARELEAGRGKEKNRDRGALGR